MSFPLLCIQLLHVLFQTVEPLFPDLPVAAGPLGYFFQRIALDAAAPPLRVPPLRDEPGVFQHAKVLGYGGHTHFERFGEFADGTFAQQETGEDGSTGGIREGCECNAQSIFGHLLFN
jgi:hypothetical protein